MKKENLYPIDKFIIFLSLFSIPFCFYLSYVYIQKNYITGAICFFILGILPIFTHWKKLLVLKNSKTNKITTIIKSFKQS